MLNLFDRFTAIILYSPVIYYSKTLYFFAKTTIVCDRSKCTGARAQTHYVIQGNFFFYHNSVVFSKDFKYEFDFFYYMFFIVFNYTRIICTLF